MRADRIAGGAAQEHDITFAMQRLGHPFGPGGAGIMLVPIEIGDIIFVVAGRIGGPWHDLYAGVGRRAQRGQLRLAPVGNDSEGVDAFGGKAVDIGYRPLQVALADADHLLDVGAFGRFGADGGHRSARPAVDAKSVMDAERDFLVSAERGVRRLGRLGDDLCRVIRGGGRQQAGTERYGHSERKRRCRVPRPMHVFLLICEPVGSV